MLEVNAIYFILLLEGFALLALILLLWVLIALFRLRRKRNAIDALVRRIEQRAARRNAQTGSFLQAVYQLEGNELRAAMETIGKHETEFFELLRQCLARGRPAQIDVLDSALERLVDAYKCLQPRALETPTEQIEALQELDRVRGENQQLRQDLSLAKNKLSDLISEFGNMFGGGRDHELALEEVKEKVAAMHAENQIDIKLQS